MIKNNQNYGPNGTMNDSAPLTSWDESMDGILKDAPFVPKELGTFNEDREKILNIGAYPLQGGTQYPLPKVNVEGNEDYGSVTDAY